MLNHPYIILVTSLVISAPYAYIKLQSMAAKRKQLEFIEKKKAIEASYLQWRNELKNKVTTNTKALRILPTGEKLTGNIDYYDVTHKKFHFSADDTTLNPSFVEEKSLYPIWL